MRRDRSARRARPADRTDRQPRPDRASRLRSCSGSASTSRRPTRQIRHILLPKDYVRLRLTGEHAIDVADASGHAALRRRGPALVGRGLRRARGAGGVAAAGVRVDGDRRRRRPGGRRARDRHHGARPGLRRARHVRRRLRGAACLRARRRGARARLLPCGAGHLACDGRDAQRRRLGGLASARARRRPGRRSTQKRPAGSPASRGSCSRPYLAGERTPHADRERARCVHRPLAFATTAARSGGRCSKASRTASATRSSCSARSASSRRSGASRAAAPAASSGCASSPRCSGCRSSGPCPRKARRSAQRCSPACAKVSSPTPTRPLRAACASATASSRIRPGPLPTIAATDATAASTPLCSRGSPLNPIRRSRARFTRFESPRPPEKLANQIQRTNLVRCRFGQLPQPLPHSAPIGGPLNLIRRSRTRFTRFESQDLPRNSRIRFRERIWRVG